MALKIIKWEDNRYHHPYRISDDKNIYALGDGSVFSDDLKLLHKIRNIEHIPCLIQVFGNNDRWQSNMSTNELFVQINDTIRTSNLVGVVNTPPDSEKNQLRVEINSRFDRPGSHYFLIYLLSNVYGFQLYDESIHSADNTALDVIVCVLFLEKLREAYRKGLFKVYKRFRYNDFDFKGSFDVSRHIKMNVPFTGKTAYVTREYTYDNELLCMIRQTIDYVKNKYHGMWNTYINQNVELGEIENVLEEATPSYQRSVAYQRSLLCQRSVTHPMFSEYEEVRQLCLRILEEQGTDIFENSIEEAYALLIDMSWLWEEFVAQRLLGEENYSHILASKGRSGMGIYYASQKGPWYPDFLEKSRDENARRNIIDAKYKKWDFERDDMHQLLSYLYLTGGHLCGAVFPIKNGEEKQEFSRIQLNPYYEFYDKDVYCYKFPFVIPAYDEETDYSVFCKQMEENIEAWKKAFAEIGK